MAPSCSRILRSKVAKLVASSSRRPAFCCSRAGRPALHGTRSRCRTHGSAGFRGVFVIAHADGKIQRDRFKITSGAAHAAHSQFFKGLPIADQHVGVYQRNFHAVGERVLLHVRQIGAQIWNHHVPAGEDASGATHAARTAVFYIGDLDFFRGACFTDIARENHGAVQPQAHGRSGIIESSVIELGRNDIFHGVARARTRESASAPAAARWKRCRRENEKCRARPPRPVW